MVTPSNHCSRIVRMFFVLAFALVALNVTASGATAGASSGGGVSASVVGGTPVGDHDFPSLAAIMVHFPEIPARDRLLCTGTLITHRWVLTAGHCAEGLLFGPPLEVQLANPALGATGALTVRVNRGVVHRVWLKHGVGYDIALFHLQESVESVPYSRLAMAADLPLLAEGNTATIVGWGLTKRLGIEEPPAVNARIPVRARASDVPIVGDAACAAVFRDVAPHYFVPASDLCAGSEGHNVCYGDSGGPIYAKDPQGQLVQIGVTSRGAGCATKMFPSIFTDVRRLHGWIHRWTNHPCPTRFAFSEDPGSPDQRLLPIFVC